MSRGMLVHGGRERGVLFASRSLLALILMLSAGARADSVAQADEAYQAVIAEAVSSMNEQRYEEARAAFQRAHELKPSARTLRGLAAAELALNRYAAADVLFRAALADSRRPLTPEQYAEAQQALTGLQARLGRFRVVLSPSTAELTVDAAPAVRDRDGTLVLQQGTHVLSVHAPDHENATRQVEVKGGEDAVLKIALTASAPAAPPPPQPLHVHARGGRARPTAGWSIVAAGGGLAIVGSTLLGLGLHDRSRVENAKDGTRLASVEEAQARVPMRTGVGIAAAAVGFAAVGLGVWLLTAREHERDASLRVALMPSGALLTGAF